MVYIYIYIPLGSMMLIYYDYYYYVVLWGLPWVSLYTGDHFAVMVLTAVASPQVADEELQAGCSLELNGVDGLIMGWLMMLDARQILGLVHFWGMAWELGLGWGWKVCRRLRWVLSLVQGLILTVSTTLVQGLILTVSTWSCRESW